MFLAYVGSRRNMREKIESAVQRSRESFEQDFEEAKYDEIAGIIS